MVVIGSGLNGDVEVIEGVEGLSRDIHGHVGESGGVVQGAVTGKVDERGPGTDDGGVVSRDSEVLGLGGVVQGDAGDNLDESRQQSGHELNIALTGLGPIPRRKAGGGGGTT